VLKKINRIQKRSDFELLKEKGQMVPGNLVGMLWLKDGEGEENRFGFIISKRISKRAVDRNRIKRLLSEAIKINLDKVKSKGNKVVFLAKKTMLGKKLPEVVPEIVGMMEKIK
jgi:ribonuclease P protein component